MLAIAARLADLDGRWPTRHGARRPRCSTDGSGRSTIASASTSSPPTSNGARRLTGAALMVELLGIVIAVLCFVAAFGLIVLLDRV